MESIRTQYLYPHPQRWVGGWRSRKRAWRISETGKGQLASGETCTRLDRTHTHTHNPGRVEKKKKKKMKGGRGSKAKRKDGLQAG